MNDTHGSLSNHNRPATPVLKDSSGRRIRMESPRLCAAMRAEGVEPESLRMRHIKSFRRDGKAKIRPEIAEKRHQSYEAIRLENTALVLAARRVVSGENALMSLISPRKTYCRSEDDSTLR